MTPMFNPVTCGSRQVIIPGVAIRVAKPGHWSWEPAVDDNGRAEGLRANVAE